MSLLCALFLGSVHASLAQAGLDDIRKSLAVVQGTALYMDCATQDKLGSPEDASGVKTHWAASLSQAKSVLESKNGDMARWAIAIEEGIDYNTSKTHAVAEDVLKRVKETSLYIDDTDDSPQTFTDDSPEIVVTSGLLKRVCKVLKPSADLSTILLEAKVISAKPKVDATRLKALVDESSVLSASYLLGDIRYAGLRLFTTGHELSHASLDKFSTDLTRGDAHSGGQECRAAFFMETRADMVGQVVVEATPLKTMLGDGFADHIKEFSEEEIASMTQAAELLSSDDQLKIIVNAKEWRNDSCLSPEQRQEVLRGSVLRRLQAKTPEHAGTAPH